jgi:hypothetical protein
MDQSGTRPRGSELSRFNALRHGILSRYTVLPWEETELADWYRRERMELIHRPAVRDQAFGEALDPVKIERLCRYEVHLDRKLERTLGMLFRLRELRRPADEA